MELQNDICTVQICIDKLYTIDSTDNKPYDLVINPHNLKRYDMHRVFSIQIDLFYTKLSIALIGDFYIYDTDCAVLEDDVLTVLQDRTIVQIDVHTGTLLKFKEFDCFGCNYGIYKVKNGYIIYGELEITMLDCDFNKKWFFKGEDYFVSISKEKRFELLENSIRFFDFADNFYEMDYEGNLITEKKKEISIKDRLISWLSGKDIHVQFKLRNRINK